MVLAKPTVLVVDDEPHVGELFKKVFGEDGYEVLTAENGAQGIELAMTRHPDVVILDLVMPGMNGMTALRRLREAGVASRVVIILTACGSLESAREAMELGAHEYVTKPFNLEFLKAVVRDGIRREDGEERPHG